MIIFSSVLLALTIGMTIGINVKQFVRPKRKKNMSSVAKISHSEDLQTDFQTFLPYFDTLEIRFLNRIIMNKEEPISVNDTNEILRIERLSKENQRQRRHLFLKDLNIKLKMIYKVPECIERKPTEMDRRSKYYSLNESITKESIEAMLTNEQNK
jgi:hypothetical protein